LLTLEESQTEERVSFGIFTDNDLDSKVYSMEGEYLNSVFPSYGDFIVHCFEETYSADANE